MERKKALIFDVGHVVCAGSIMNHLSDKLSTNTKNVVLYDNELLENVSGEILDEWVSAVCKIKICGLYDVSLHDISRVLLEFPLTPGFREIVGRANENGIDVILIGAVARQITNLFMQCHDVKVGRIYGSELAISNNRICGIESIMTPSLKRTTLDKIFREPLMDPGTTIVVGDSVGDLQMMGMVPRENRIAFNATNASVHEFVESCFAGSMHPVIQHLEKTGFFNS